MALSETIAPQQNDIVPVKPSNLSPDESIDVIYHGVRIEGVFMGLRGAQTNNMRIKRNGESGDIVEIPIAGYGSDPDLVVGRSNRRYSCQRPDTTVRIDTFGDGRDYDGDYRAMSKS